MSRLLNGSKGDSNPGSLDQDHIEYLNTKFGMSKTSNHWDKRNKSPFKIVKLGTKYEGKKLGLVLYHYSLPSL